MRRLIWIVAICVLTLAMAQGAEAHEPHQQSVCLPEQAGQSDLSAIRVAVLGDSMSWIGGDSCQNPRGWTHFLKLLANPKHIDIYARSGATWTNTKTTRGDISAYSEVLDDENVLYPQALRLIKAAQADPSYSPELIFLYAGANDAWFFDKRPGIFDATRQTSAQDVIPAECTSLQYSIVLVCDTLRKAFPDARMVLMTPAEMTKAPVWRIRLVSEIIADTGRRLGLTVLRPDIDVDIRKELESIILTNTSDGVHTNPRGAELLARYVISKI